MAQSSLMPNQLICTTDTGSVTEVSTMDDPDDNYRVIPGDGQKILKSC